MIGAVIHFNIDRFPNFLCRPETDTYFIDRRWKQGNSEGDRSQVECEQHSPIQSSISYFADYEIWQWKWQGL
jgi:hypothetical protein